MVGLPGRHNRSGTTDVHPGCHRLCRLTGAGSQQPQPSGDGDPGSAAGASSGALVWGYTYNAREQLVRRNLNVGGVNLTHFVHDIFGNVIAETNGTAAGTVREYIWLPEAEIAPTYQSQAQVDRPLAVVDGVNATPALWMVHVDHLNRPIRMTDAAKASVWDAVWLPWGGSHAITGMATMNARFPGQWFQLEAGLHYNWHRHYDASIGRYTQPDPLGFVDGASVYGYAGGSPLQWVDPDGLKFKPSWKGAKDFILLCAEIVDALFGTNIGPGRRPPPNRPPIEIRAPTTTPKPKPPTGDGPPPPPPPPTPPASK